MAQAKGYTRQELQDLGRLSKRDLRKAIAGLQNRNVGCLPKRLESAMRNQRSALSLLGLVLESSDSHEAYYEPVVAVIWAAYLRWHGFDKKKSVIDGAHFIKGLLSGEERFLVYVAARSRGQLLDYVHNNRGSRLSGLRLVRNDRAMLAG